MNGHKAGLNLTNENQVAPIHVAARAADGCLLEWLLKAEANPNNHFSDGATPLLLAAQKGRCHHVQLLLEAKAEVNAGRWRDHATPYCVVWGKAGT